MVNIKVTATIYYIFEMGYTSVLYLRQDVCKDGNRLEKDK